MRIPTFAGHRSAFATAGAVVAVVAVVAGVAVASGGYAAQRVDLGDAAVWVANDRLQAVGRANTAILELNSVVETGGSSAEIVQQGSTVLVFDRDRASVGIVDPVTSTVTDTVAVPPEGTSIALAGTRVVVAAGGDMWSVPAADFADFDLDADPMLAFGAGAVTTVDPAGVMFAYTPSRGTVARVNAADEETVASRWQLDPVDGRRRRADHVGRRALGGARRHRADAAARRPPGRPFGEPRSVDDAVLQEPAVTGDSIVIAHRRGLLSVGLDGGEPKVLEDQVAGAPAAPVLHDGCLHAAWASGEAWRSCPGAGAQRAELDDATGAGAVAFLVNGDTLVLNDAKSGKAWAASDDYGLPIDNWDALLDRERDEETVKQDECPG